MARVRSGGTDRFSWAEDARSEAGVDGGWWPRCPDPLRELPTLAAVLAERGYGPIAHVQANVDDWVRHPTAVTVRGVAVPMTWFTLLFEHRLIVRCITGRRLTLTVVPFDIAESRASTALRHAADADSPGMSPPARLRALGARLRPRRH
ncbi:MAG TPA: DUF5994 family protein [Actinocatenispora sp.]